MTTDSRTTSGRKHMDSIARWEFEKILNGRHPQGAEYGGRPELTVASGRATCRFCFGKIAKGEPAYRWAHDFQGCGSWTVITSYVHGYDCALSPMADSIFAWVGFLFADEVCGRSVCDVSIAPEAGR